MTYVYKYIYKKVCNTYYIIYMYCIHLYIYICIVYIKVYNICMQYIYIHNYIYVCNTSIYIDIMYCANYPGSPACSYGIVWSQAEFMYASFATSSICVFFCLFWGRLPSA